MARRPYAASPLGDQKAALERMIERKIDAMDARQGVGVNTDNTANATPQFGTGYDTGTGLTTTTLLWDLGTWDNEDVWSA